MVIIYGETPLQIVKKDDDFEFLEFFIFYIFNKLYLFLRFFQNYFKKIFKKSK